MEVDVITIFLSRASVRVIVFNRGDDGQLVNCTTAKLTIKDPDGVKKVDDQAMNNISTGIYDYVYHKGEGVDPLDAGVWTYEGDVWDGSGAGAINSPFEGEFTVR